MEYSPVLGNEVYGIVWSKKTRMDIKNVEELAGPKQISTPSSF